MLKDGLRWSETNFERLPLSSFLKSQAKRPRPLGRQAYAAMAAVEGLRLNKVSEDRLANLREKNLSPDERRAEVIRAYSNLSAQK